MIEAFTSRSSKHWKFIALLALFAIVFMLAGAIALLPRQDNAQAVGGMNGATYLNDNGHSDFNSAETIINPTSAPHLRLYWSYLEHGSIQQNFISVQPIEANNMIYWGSWDGNMHATNLSGQQVWQQSLGYIYNSQCNSTNGVVSTATVASVTIGGNLTSVVFVAGGDDNFYALDANSGAILWRTALGSPPNNFIWGSPTVFNGNVYIGMASFGDCPLVQGKVVQLNSTTGAIQHTFYTVPGGCIGGGVASSPAIDPVTSTLYFATGNEGTCATKETMTDGIVALRTSDLSLLSFWQIPASQRPSDSDFLSSPTLFPATIAGAAHKLVGVANKNGVYYALDSTAISKGPLWSLKVAGVGGGCGPRCGDGSISPSAWDGKTLYVAGGQTSIGRSSCKGSLRALNPSNGAILWQDCFNSGPVLGAVSMVPGVAIVGAGYKFVLVSTSNGHTLYSYADNHKGSYFYGAASISNGVLYIGNYDGTLYAFGT